MRDQILDLEKKYWEAIEVHDFEKVKALTYFPCTVAGSKGVKSLDEATYKKLSDQGKDIKMTVKGITDVIVQTISNSFATIAYILEIEGENNGQKNSNKCACTSVWVLENGHWKCLLHTESDLK